MRRRIKRDRDALRRAKLYTTGTEGGALSKRKGGTENGSKRTTASGGGSGGQAPGKKSQEDSKRVRQNGVDNTLNPGTKMG